MSPRLNLGSVHGNKESINKKWSRITTLQDEGCIWQSRSFWQINQSDRCKRIHTCLTLMNAGLSLLALRGDDVKRENNHVLTSTSPPSTLFTVSEKSIISPVCLSAGWWRWLTCTWTVRRRANTCCSTTRQVIMNAVAEKHKSEKASLTLYIECDAACVCLSSWVEVQSKV